MTDLDNITMLEKQRLFMPGLKERFAKMDRIIDLYMKFCPTDITLYINLKDQELREKFQQIPREEEEDEEREVQHCDRSASGKRSEG